MEKYPLPRVDTDAELRKLLIKYCRLTKGEIWRDPISEHRIACIDSTDPKAVKELMNGTESVLAIHDPPYNFIAFDELKEEQFISWSEKWIKNSFNSLALNSSIYIWLGADYKNHFQPFASFIQMMKNSGFESRNYITLRNQRGYGTTQNWMAIRQELLYYTKGAPVFNVETVYTDIPKILKGYYKEVGGEITENTERSRSEFIRPGNVWVDVQQVFYRMEENVNGCFAQKPLKAIERIVNASSNENDIIIDFFAHSGTTLISCEKLKRKCFTADIDPIFCEISIRRLERFRNTGKTGWQNSNPFYEEIIQDNEIKEYLAVKHKINYWKENDGSD
ncbi:MAG: site-specific DNA-methyltransferase [Ignavibacterium sp.]|nr:site-specific DNA-methyltransferase [Ignavibacterium sp.]